jgi:hypothetical protein
MQIRCVLDLREDVTAKGSPKIVLRRKADHVLRITFNWILLIYGILGILGKCPHQPMDGLRAVSFILEYFWVLVNLSTHQITVISSFTLWISYSQLWFHASLVGLYQQRSGLWTY